MLKFSLFSSILTCSLILTLAYHSKSGAIPAETISNPKGPLSESHQPLRDWLTRNILNRENKSRNLNTTEIEAYIIAFNTQAVEFKKLLATLITSIEASSNGEIDKTQYPSLFHNAYEISTIEPYIILHDKSAKHPTVLLNRTKTFNDFILELPHADRELNSLALGFSLVEKLQPRAAIFSGLGRCSIAKESSCAIGGTAVCSNFGIREPFAMSDAAHSPTTLFDTTHRILVDLWPSSLVLQLHDARTIPLVPLGMVLSSGIDPARPFSSRISSNNLDDINHLNVTTLKKLLRQEFANQVEPALIESCQSYEKHPTLSSVEEFARSKRVSSLCATTNLQGRYLNLARSNLTPSQQDSLICTPEIPQDNSDRFIHIEAMAHYLDFSSDSNATKVFVKAFERFLAARKLPIEKEISL